MYTAYFMCKHGVLLLDLRKQILRVQREQEPNESVVSHLDTVQALTAAGQGDVLNKPERSATEALKLPDSL